MIRLLPLIACAALVRADSLEEILKRMDQSAKTFQNFTAKFKQTEYTDILKQSDESAGEIRIKRNKSSLTGLVIFNAPENRVVSFSGGTAQIYYPNARTVEIYDAGKYRGEMDRWLSLGFGTSSAELRQGYDIKAVGTEKIGSKNTTRLQLTPRSPELKKLVATVDLWIPEGDSHPIREKVVTPSKDYRLFDYSDLKINQSLPNSDFELKVPPGVRKTYPGKG